MDLFAIGKIIAPLAPMAGSILADLIPLPIPGKAAMGRKLGELIAGQFGLPPTATTAQVSDAIATAGEETARAKINAAVEQARIQIDGFVAYERAILEAQVKNLSDVNATMRAEIAVPIEQREHWFFRAWRPAFAWGVLVIYVPFGLVLSFTALRSAYLSPDPLKTLAEAWPLLVGFFAIGLAVVGVLIPSRSMEKKAAIENGAPMPNAKPVIKDVTPAKISTVPSKPTIIPDPPGSR